LDEHLSVSYVTAGGYWKTELTLLFNFTLEFDNESDLQETTRNLLGVHGITGEIGARRLKDGRWRLEVNAERRVTENLLHSLKGRVTSAPADVAGA
jgi:hypothetical protein